MAKPPKSTKVMECLPKKILSDLASKLLILLFKNDFVMNNRSIIAQTDVLKNILPLNSILSKFSELDILRGLLFVKYSKP